MEVFRSETSDLSFAHEDDLEWLLREHVNDGESAALHVMRSDDDELYFVSSKPITVERITKEFPDEHLCINGSMDDE